MLCLFTFTSNLSAQSRGQTPSKINMRIITDIEHTSEEIYGLIESVTIIKDNWFAEHVTENKVFQGFYVSKGIVIAPLREKDDSLRGNNYWFLMYVRDGKNGKPDLIMHVFPSLVLFFLFLMIGTGLISVFTDVRGLLFTIPWILFITIGYIRTYVIIKKLLLSIFNP